MYVYINLSCVAEGHIFSESNFLEVEKEKKAPRQTSSLSEIKRMSRVAPSLKRLFLSKHRLYQHVNQFIFSPLVPVLCFTITATAVDVLSKYWAFGPQNLILCRVFKASPCFAVFYSSLTIVAIAIDRYRFVVYSHLTQLELRHVSYVLALQVGVNLVTCWAIYKECINLQIIGPSLCSVIAFRYPYPPYSSVSGH